MKFLFLLVFLAACGNRGVDNQPNYKPLPPGVTHVNPEELVILGTASFKVDLSQKMKLSSYPVTVTITENASLAIDTSQFVVPVMVNELLSFGNIQVTSVFTNSLKKCGPGGNIKCTKALLRIYTTGTAGAGFWNTTDSYGAQIYAGLAGSLQAIPLGQSLAITAEQYTIPANRNSVRLTDFVPPPVFIFQGDFTDAGVGSYSTTINIDFALAP